MEPENMAPDRKNEMSVEDILAAIQRLLADPDTGEIVRDAGTHRDFSDDESRSVFNFVASDEIFRYYDKHPHRSPRDVALGNSWLIVGMSRRVSEGEFSSASDQKIIDFVSKNIVASDTKVDEHGNEVEWRPIRERRMPFDEFYMVLLEYMETPSLKQLHKNWLAIAEEVGDWNFYDSESKRVIDEFGRPAMNIMRKYGFVYLPPLLTVARKFLDSNFDVKNPEEVKSAMRRMWPEATMPVEF